LSAALPETLEKQGIARAPEAPAMIMSPIHCDLSGSIYLLPLQPPLLKFASDGSRKASFDSSAAWSDGLGQLMMKTFAVGPDGSVYELGKRRDDERVIVLRLDSEGRYAGSLKLDEKFDPGQLGVFRNGSFFAAGLSLLKAGADPEFAPFAAVFDVTGRLINRVESAAADGLKKSAASGPPPDFSIVESDGAWVYLLRPGRSPELYAISAAGIIDHALTIEPPHPGEQVSALRVGAGRILVEYIQPKGLPNGNDAYDMVLYNAEDGTVLTRFDRASDIFGPLACTDWRGHFSFLSSDEHGSVLLTAGTR
jgi:hypothetical protein